MDRAILLTKLANFDDDDFELYRDYVTATSESFETADDEFNYCLSALKSLIGKQYDFEWLNKNAKVFECTRRDFSALCDDVCSLLGNRITELGKRATFVVKPSKFENYCPFVSDSLVCYGKCNRPENGIMYDGTRYTIIDTKVETTPYYTICINRLDM